MWPSGEGFTVLPVRCNLCGSHMTYDHVQEHFQVCNLSSRPVVKPSPFYSSPQPYKEQLFHPSHSQPLQQELSPDRYRCPHSHQHRNGVAAERNGAPSRRELPPQLCPQLEDTFSGSVSGSVSLPRQQHLCCRHPSPPTIQPSQDRVFEHSPGSSACTKRCSPHEALHGCKVSVPASPHGRRKVISDPELWRRLNSPLESEPAPRRTKKSRTAKLSTPSLEYHEPERGRNSISPAWCRLCEIDCFTVEGLKHHSKTRDHMDRSLDIVSSIKSRSWRARRS